MFRLKETYNGEVTVSDNFETYAAADWAAQHDHVDTYEIEEYEKYND